VREGDPLIGIDPRPFEAALREKHGMLAKSQVQLSKANETKCAATAGWWAAAM